MRPASQFSRWLCLICLSWQGFGFVVGSAQESVALDPGMPASAAVAPADPSGSVHTPSSAVVAVTGEEPAVERKVPATEVSTGAVDASDTMPSGEAADGTAEGQRLRDAIVQDRDSAAALDLGWTYFEKKQWPAAKQWFELTLDFDPQSSRAAEGLVMSAFRSGKPAEAYQLATSHSALVPEGRDIVARAAAASASQLVEDGELEKAESYLEGMPENERSIADIRRAIAAKRVETAVARRNFDEARTIASSNGIDDAPVARDESADLLQQATEARDIGKHSESLALVEQAEKVAPLERGGRRVKAWALYENRDYDQSASLFEDLYREGRDRDSADGLVNSLQQGGDLPRLTELSNELGGPLASASEPVLMAAARAEQDRERELAMARERDQQMLASQEAAAQDNMGAGNTDVPVPEEFGGRMVTKIAAASSSRYADNPIEPRRRAVPEGPRIDAGGGFRVKEGDGGIDRLRVTHLPSVETTLVFGAGDNQSLTLSVHALKLEAGDTPGPRLIGTADSTLDPRPLVSETDTLVQPTLAYRLEKGQRAFFAEIGATPIGADISAAAIGGVGFEWNGDGAAAGIQGFSESVEESLLSYTGMTDPYTGEDWGRVVRRGVRADGVLDLGQNLSAHGLFEFSKLTGEGVADNSSFAADIGLSYELDIDGFEYVAIGPTFHYETYDKNLSGFTRGHGGYFSPDELFQGMFGVGFMTETGGSFLAEGYVGVGAQTNDQAASPLFPNAPDGQFYNATSDSSAIFTARLQALMELNPHWRLGAQAGYAKTAAYEDFAVSLYLSFLFDPEFGLSGSDFRK